MQNFLDLKNGSFVIYGTMIVSAILVLGVTSIVAEVAIAQVQPDLNAAGVYDSGQMNLGLSRRSR